MLKNLDHDAHAIVALGVWKKASAYNWVLLPQTSEEPIVVHVEPKSEGPVAGRIFFFPGFAAYRDFALLLQAPDAGIALSTETEFVDRFDGTVTIIYRNNRDIATLTGIAGLDYAVYAAAVAALSAMALFIIRRRREYAEEDRA